MSKKSTPETGITRAVRIAGGQAALAEQISARNHGSVPHVSQQVVSIWMRRGYVPPNRATEISECTRNRVSPAELLKPELRQIVETSANTGRTGRHPSTPATTCARSTTPPIYPGSVANTHGAADPT